MHNSWTAVTFLATVIDLTACFFHTHWTSGIFRDVFAWVADIWETRLRLWGDQGDRLVAAYWPEAAGVRKEACSCFQCKCASLEDASVCVRPVADLAYMIVLSVRELFS